MRERGRSQDIYFLSVFYPCSICGQIRLASPNRWKTLSLVLHRDQALRLFEELFVFVSPFDGHAILLAEPAPHVDAAAALAAKRHGGGFARLETLVADRTTDEGHGADRRQAPEKGTLGFGPQSILAGRALETRSFGSVALTARVALFQHAPNSSISLLRLLLAFGRRAARRRFALGSFRFARLALAFALGRLAVA